MTDLDYADGVVLTASGYALPKTMPADLLEIHEAEREEKRLLQLVRALQEG